VDMPAHMLARNATNLFRVETFVCVH
jgi:hypothetical protein